LRLAADHADGRSVVRAAREMAVHSVGSLLVVETRWVYRVDHGGPRAYDYSTLAVQPGWFVQALTPLVTQEPLLFARSCAPARLQEFLARQQALAPAD
jgi:hypothetical protein